MSTTIPHVYLHVPYCSGKCTYCVLYSRSYRADQATPYVDAVLREIDLALAAGLLLRPETIFIGGGTPSILEDTLFARLLLGLRSRIDASLLTEWTLEAQPGTFTPAKLEAMRAAGVNRISMGVQALTDATLARVGRRHTVADVDRSVAMLHEAGFDNVGIDLIACLPEVSSTEWRATVQRAAAMPLRHLSVYALTMEDGSLLAAKAARGEYQPPDEEAQIAELDVAEALLATAGYTRYEFSNYARPGSACLHNLAYWRGRDYLGFGPAASSRLGRERWTNVADANAYTKSLAVGSEPARERDTLDARTDCTERLIFGFRLAEGVEVAPFAQDDQALADHWRAALHRLRAQGLAEERGPRWALTATGRLYADAVAEELIPAS